MAKLKKLNITGIRKKGRPHKPFPKKKNWRSGYDPAQGKKSYKRWIPPE